MCDAGVREPVPEEPQAAHPAIDPLPTRQEIEEMDDAAYAVYSRCVVVVTKRAQIANIDRQIAKIGQQGGIAPG